MRLEKILIPVADPERPGSAPALASAIARQTGASITLLHVVDEAESEPIEDAGDETIISRQLSSDPESGGQIAAVTSGQETGELPSIEITRAAGESADVAERLLKAHSARFQADQVPTAVAVVGGKPSETIPLMAHTGEFDLVVMESVRGSRIAKMLFGSTADQVESELQIPVIMLQPDDDARIESKLAPDAIIVPLDSDPDSEHVVPLAQELAQTLGCNIELVHAVTSSMFVTHPATPLTTPVTAAINSQVDDAQEYLEQIAIGVRESGVKVGTTVETESPVDLIQRVANRYRNALIVTHSSERSGIVRLLFGRLSEDLVLNTGNPVMVVPNPLGPVID